MAVDTAAKRFSMLVIDNFNEMLFQVDGAVDTDDRAHLVGLYSGIALDVPSVGTGDVSGVSVGIRRRRRKSMHKAR